MQRIIALLMVVAFSLVGCSLAPKSVQNDVEKVQADIAQGQKTLAQFTAADLTAAAARANKATDPGAPYRARCYLTLLKHVPDGSTVGSAIPALAGPVDGFEALAELDAKARAGGGGSIIPADVHADCAVIVTSVNQFLIRIGVLAAGATAGAPGIGSALGGIGAAVPGIINAIPKPLP